jgi:acetylornithine deacetylase/succinyl-diaminopimelate desuccinylase-like protein
MFNLLEECKKLISIRSDKEAGNRQLVDHLVPYCRSVGLNITLQPGKDPKEINLIAHTVPSNSKDLCPQGILLNTHLDTVPGGDTSRWTETGNDPFRPTLKGDLLFGRGSADTKLDFLCKLKALENIQTSFSKPLREIFKIPIALVGTYGEEQGLLGARFIWETGVMHPKFALVGEPCELKPVIAHKGVLYMRAWCSISVSQNISNIEEKIFRGKAAHGSTPQLGENAIYKGIDWLLQKLKEEPNLEAIEVNGGTVHNIVPEECRIKVGRGETPSKRTLFLKKFFELHQKTQDYLETHSDPEFDPPPTTTNVGVIRTSETKIEIEFDYRLIPQTDSEKLLKILKQLQHEAHLDVILLDAPMVTRKDSEMAQVVKTALQKVELSVEFFTKSGNTEGAVYNAMGAQSIIFGPGLAKGNIHASNEFMYVSQLFKAAEFYEAFLRQFC